MNLLNTILYSRSERIAKEHHEYQSHIQAFLRSRIDGEGRKKCNFGERAHVSGLVLHLRVGFVLVKFLKFCAVKFVLNRQEGWDSWRHIGSRVLGGFLTLAILCRNLAVPMGYVDAQEGALGRTAFRTAEKLYKRYKNSSTQLRTSKSGRKVPPIDVSEVLDFRKYAEVLKGRNSKVDGVSLASGGPFDTPVFVVDGHPGFYFLPQALSIEEQFYWIQESLASFPQPPNRTNHNAVYGPISDLWASAQQGRVLVEVFENGRDRQEKLLSQPDSGPPHPDGTKDYLTDEFSKGFDHLEITSSPSSSIPDHAECKDGRPPWPDASLMPALTQGMCKARIVNERVEEVANCWHFIDEQGIDSSSATKRSKHQSAKSLVRKLRWATIGLQFDWSKKAYNTMVAHKELSPKLSELAARLARPAMNGEKFNAEAAIVNYYGPDDMLGGHVDDMEADWSKPIVSISLGSKAVFLLGGTSREDTPIAMFLRSGDVVLMAGPARQCFHGVPRIFIEPENSDLPDLSTIDQASLRPFLDYIMESRININVRQVH